MNYTRIYSDKDFSLGERLSLSTQASQHLGKVLRKRRGNFIQLFDGKGSSCIAEITSQKKNDFEIIVVDLVKFQPRQGICISLGQSLIKPDPFSYSIQKATELGVVSFSPLISKRTSMKLNNINITKKNRWEKIAIASCQQCGENWLPKIRKIQSLRSWCNKIDAKHRIVLLPGAEKKISSINFKESVAIAIGPEGDFTDKEVLFLKEKGFIPVNLGKRILRAETAVVASLSAIRTVCREF